MVLKPVRNALSAIAYCPNYAHRLVVRTQASCHTLAAIPHKTARGQCLTALKLNALVALGYALPATGVRRQAAMVGLGGSLHKGALTLRLGRALLPLSTGFGLPHPLRIMVGAQTVLMQGLLALLAGDYKQRGPLLLPQGRKAFGRLLLRYGVLGLPELVATALAARFGTNGWPKMGAACLLAADLLGVVPLCARLARDGAYVLTALPLAAAMMLLGLAVDGCTIGFARLKGMSSMSERYLFATRLPEQPPATPGVRGPDAIVRRGVPGVFHPHQGAPDPRFVAWDQAGLSTVGQTLEQAQRRAQRRAETLDHELAVLSHLVAQMEMPGLTRYIVAREVNFVGYCDHLMDFLRVADDPNVRHLFMNRPNLSRYGLFEIERLQQVWAKKLTMPPLEEEILAALHDAKKINECMHDIRCIFGPEGPDDSRLRYLSADLLRSQPAAVFNEAWQKARDQENAQNARPRVGRKQAAPSTLLRALTEAMAEVQPIMEHCVAAMRTPSMWSFYEGLIPLDATADQRALRHQGIHRLTADLSSLQKPSSPLHEEGGKMAALWWRSLEKIWQTPPAGTMNMLRKLRVSTSPDRIERLTEARPHEARNLAEAAGLSSDEMKAALKQWSHALFTLSTNLEQTAAIWKQEPVATPMRRASSR